MACPIARPVAFAAGVQPGCISCVFHLSGRCLTARRAIAGPVLYSAMGARGKTYEEIRGQIQTADIVLFSGKSAVSEWIKWFTRSTWSHVGMALRSVEWDMLLLWESTALSSLKDVETGQAVRGVQLVPLSERVKTYAGRVAVRHLSKGITESMRKALSAFRREVSGRPYEKRYIDLIRAAYDGPFGQNRENLSSLFCSELVAEAYQRMGLLPDEKQGPPSDEYTPRDFSTESKQPLRLLMEYVLGEEILIEESGGAS